MEPGLIQRLEEQRSAWNSGQRVLVEELVEGPIAPEDLMDFIYAEVVLRESAGERVTPEEYCNRFPDLATEITKQFQIHILLSSDRGTVRDGNSRSTIEVPGFQIVEQAGSGGSGVVYKARDRKIDRLVAIKVLMGTDAIQERGREQLMREAAAAASLKHPAIVEIYQVGETDGIPFIVMEFMASGSLGALVRRNPLSPERALEILIPVTEAVRHAHHNDVIHRDLKPDNILLDTAQQPHVADFGLARRLDENQSLHASGDVIGTPAYMSPEQVRGEAATVRSDVYALGAVLYQVLTGRVPFQAATGWEVLEQTLSHDPPKLRELNPALPKDLETICEKCLQKAPDRRYDSTAELLTDLKLAAEGRPIVARPVSGLDRFLRWCKREPRLAFAVAATFALAVALTVVSTVAIYRIANAESETEAQRTLARESRVRAVIGAEPAALPRAIEALDLQDPITKQLLVDCVDDPTRDAGERLRAACGLAAMGDRRTQLILDSVVLVPARRGTCRNILAALGKSTPELIAELATRSQSGDARHRMRYAVLALFLRSPEPAEALVQMQPDPLPRTRFVHELGSWMGPDEALVKVLRDTRNSHLQAALCLAVGNIDRLTLARKERGLIEWCLTDLTELPNRSAVVHSAADWAARKWGLTMKGTAKAGPDWFTNSLGVRMIQVPAGSFVMGSTTKRGSFHDVTLTEPLCYAALEVTREQFEMFLGETPNVPGNLRPSDVEISPSKSHPAQNMSWNAAVEFCNWLSARENRTPCYTRTKPDTDLADNTNRVDMWRCDFDADGYRLPTDAEWEYAARCGAETRFTWADEGLISHYARASNDRKIPAFPVGSLIPNPLGLFDLHGNVWEFCWDNQSELGLEPRTDPRGPESNPENPRRIIRGGAIDNLSGDPSNDARGATDPRWSSWNVGFRVVTNTLSAE